MSSTPFHLKERSLLFLFLVPARNATKDTTKQSTNSFLHAAQGATNATHEIALSKLSYTLTKSSREPSNGVACSLSNSSHDIPEGAADSTSHPSDRVADGISKPLLFFLGQKSKTRDRRN